MPQQEEDLSPCPHRPANNIMEGNAPSHLSLQAYSAKLAFRERYVRRFLPLLSCVREKSAMKRYRAVKKAADLSLACTAGRTVWSKSLCRSLVAQTARRSSFGLAQTADKEAGLTFLRCLSWKRRRQARAQIVKYRKSFLRARKHKESIKLQRELKEANLQAPTLPGKLGELGQATLMEPRMMSLQCAKLEACKWSCLSELIPGGLHMDLPKLLDQTAHYIISLQRQVDALSFLAGRALSSS